MTAVRAARLGLCSPSVPLLGVARARALELGHDHEEDYVNSEGDRVVWRFAAIEALGELSANDLDGIEVYSEPEAMLETTSIYTIFSPEAYEPINTGVCPRGEFNCAVDVDLVQGLVDAS